MMFLPHRGRARLALLAALWMGLPLVLAAQPSVGGEDASTPQTDRVVSASAVAAAATSRESAPSEASAQPAPVDERAGLIGLVDRWSEAWEGQRADEYLGYYSERFQPPGDQSRQDWEANRRARITGPEFIEVAVAILGVDVPEAGRARVRFLQRYRSDRYRDVVTKTLDLVREGDTWKILQETVED